MEAQIQALIGKVTALEADNTDLHSLHATPDAAASTVEEGDEIAGDAARVFVDPTTNTLHVSGARYSFWLQKC
jgi:hypothetical protein